MTTVTRIFRDYDLAPSIKTNVITILVSVPNELGNFRFSLFGDKKFVFHIFLLK